MTNFNPLNFIADHAGMSLADAIKEAYEQGKRDAQPERKTGKWNKDFTEPLGYKCSVCGKGSCKFNFCPNCGARMEGDTE